LHQISVAAGLRARLELSSSSDQGSQRIEGFIVLADPPHLSRHQSTPSTPPLSSSCSSYRNPKLKTSNPCNHRNQQYSIIGLTNAAGTLVERYSYSAYGTLGIYDASGTVRTTSTYANRYTFTGREYDPDLNLYHFRARWYDPSTGGFISRDPLGYVDGMSLYRGYFAVASVDPSGTVVPLVPIVIGAGCAACWSAAGFIFNTAHTICSDSLDAVSYATCFVEKVSEIESNMGWYEWTAINAACLTCGGLGGAAKFFAERFSKAWAKEFAKHLALRNIKKATKDQGICYALYNEYKAMEKLAANCNTTDDCETLKTKCIAAASEVAGRHAYMNRKCDEILPDFPSGKKKGGKGGVIGGHLDQLQDKYVRAKRCCARMLEKCGDNACGVPWIPEIKVIPR
jgi:RHS repeat-associated protein